MHQNRYISDKYLQDIADRTHTKPLPGTFVPIPIVQTVNKGTFTFKNQHNLIIKCLRGPKFVSIKILLLRPNFIYIDFIYIDGKNSYTEMIRYM